MPNTRQTGGVTLGPSGGWDCGENMERRDGTIADLCSPCHSYQAALVKSQGFRNPLISVAASLHQLGLILKGDILQTPWRLIFQMFPISHGGI